ncbi:protein DNA-DAMAGE INDUCIBLE 1-like isoform X1 [Hibiscus syriacus]|uniref:protein DNA-DAMAGE INDUCIBLE 1-like isoform X1 n=1 Tax=Hibiscus syriacus TaxID=106335 RepID=UPI001923CBEE|nr:protein DNA-DAMAGE INDUCIBLE 1-like isoform X1 [Hibiscus syriacus]
MEFLFGLDMLRKHQCIIDLKDNVLRVGGGEVSVPFLQEKDIPSRFLNEERHAKQASSSEASVSLLVLLSAPNNINTHILLALIYCLILQVTSGTTEKNANVQSGGQSSG